MLPQYQTSRVAELDGAMATVGGLEPAEYARLSTRRPGQSVELTLIGQMSPYAWWRCGSPPRRWPLVCCAPGGSRTWDGAAAEKHDRP